MSVRSVSMVGAALHLLFAIRLEPPCLTLTDEFAFVVDPIGTTARPQCTTGRVCRDALLASG